MKIIPIRTSFDILSIALALYYYKMTVFGQININSMGMDQMWLSNINNALQLAVANNREVVMTEIKLEVYKPVDKRTVKQ